MLNNFCDILPEVVFDAVETLGGRCTGRSLVLNAMENRVYDVELEDESHVVIKFYRPGRWDKATIQAEHNFTRTAADNGATLAITPASIIICCGEFTITLCVK